MPPVHDQRVRFPGYSLELTGRGEVLVYRTALRRLTAALTWADGVARLDAGSLTVAGGLLRYSVGSHERAFVVRRMVEFLGDGGRTSVSLEPTSSLDVKTPEGAARHRAVERTAAAGCAGALVGALLGGACFSQVALSAGGQVPLPRDLHNPPQLLIYAFLFAVGAMPGALGGAVAGVFLSWLRPPDRDGRRPPHA